MKLEVFKSSYGYYNFRTVDGKPTEEMSEYLKTNGYRWSRNNNCWYPATAEAKEANLHDDFTVKFQEKFFPEQKQNNSFGQELFEREQRKTEWREAHGLNEPSKTVEENSTAEHIAYLETLIAELQSAHKQDLKKIELLEKQLSKKEENLADYYTQQEQEQIDEEAE